MKIRNLLIALVALGGFTLGACSSSGGALGQFEKVVNDLCACEDNECATAVMEKAEELDDGSFDPTSFSEADAKRFAELSEKMVSCMMEMPGFEDATLD